MNKKTMILLIVLLFSIGLIVGSLFSNSNASAASSEITDSEIIISEDIVLPTVVEDTSNLFVIVAKFIDKILYVVVVGVFSLITKGLELIFGI